jgi:hypothetical protein
MFNLEERICSVLLILVEQVSNMANHSNCLNAKQTIANPHPVSVLSSSCKRMCQELLELIDREGGPVQHLERLVNLTSTN